MTVYTVSYKLREDFEALDARATAELPPLEFRVKAFDATRAISALINSLKANSVVSSKGEVVILEVKVTV